MVIFLKTNYPDTFEVYGDNWMFQENSYIHDQYAESQLYRSAKIAINCSQFDYRRYSSDRILRIMGSGAFCLSKWFPEIENDYQDGKHLVLWRDFVDLKNKIDYYLKNDSERKRIARAGNELVLKKATTKMMIKNILKLYQKYK